MEVAYKPPVQYKEEFNTPITKFPLISSLCLMGLKIIKNNAVSRTSIGTTSSNLYTVPVGKTFFLTSVQLDMNVSSTFPGVLCEITQNLAGVILSTYKLPGTTTDKSRSQIITYPIPITFQVGETINNVLVIDTDSSGLVDTSLATIIGYEMDNTVIQNLI